MLSFQSSVNDADEDDDDEFQLPPQRKRKKKEGNQKAPEEKVNREGPMFHT